MIIKSRQSIKLIYFAIFLALIAELTLFNSIKANLVIIGIPVTFYVIFYKPRLNLNFILVFLSLVVVSFFSLYFNSDSLSFLIIAAFLFTGFLLAESRVSFSASELYFVLWVYALIVAYELSRYNWYGIPTLANGDPNISSLYIIIGLALSLRLRSLLLTLVFFSMGLMTLSRAFFLTSFLMTILFLGRQYFFLLYKNSRLGFAGVIFIANMFLLFIASVVDFSNRREGVRDFSRLIGNPFDANNAARFRFNADYWRAVSQDPASWFFGNGIYYKEIIGSTLHNSLFEHLAYYGFPSSLFFIFLLAVISKKVVNASNFHMFIGMIFFSMFLMGVFSSMILMSFLAILCINIKVGAKQRPL